MIETIKIVRCDKCGSEIKDEEWGVILDRFQVDHGMVELNQIPRHLCDACADRMIKWIDEEKPKAIDMPKAKALRDAGWTIKDIAEEMGVAYSTMYKKLKEGT